MTLLEIFDPKAAPRPVGIDLGTTNSLVARVRDDKPQVIADCNGVRLLPSAVHYDARGAVIVGRPALDLAAAHPRETIVSVKRFMAYSFESGVCHDLLISWATAQLRLSVEPCGDLQRHFDRHAIEQRRRELPLTDGFNRGTFEIRVWR